MKISSDGCGRIAREFYLQNKRGLHLRLAGEIAKVATRYNAEVKLVAGGHAADAKSALALLTLAATPGSRLVLVGEGQQASEAVNFLVEFITSQDRES
ncbi:MAG: HPr family phosphocarrier protein [Oligosphaeraceae bacterium]|jgi:phosphocarrier protein|nr:HPr family phosphocarrier protein [Oligosphaeraceae bacterium]